MKRYIFLTLSYLFAFLATLCCLPAALFLLFGISFSLGGITFLQDYRIIFSIVALIFFASFIFYIKKSCTLQNCLIFKPYTIAFLGITLIFLLFYPEIMEIFL